jgi:hypothetical protein
MVLQRRKFVDKLYKTSDAKLEKILAGLEKIK